MLFDFCFEKVCRPSCSYLARSQHLQNHPGHGPQCHLHRNTPACLTSSHHSALQVSGYISSVNRMFVK